MIEFYSVFMFTMLVFVSFVGGIRYIISNMENMSSSDSKSVSELSFQRYAKFLNETVKHDDKFDYKINKIYELITKDKKKEIKEIATISNCVYDECILKIKYLKHKGKLNDYYIDTIQGVVNICSPEDKKLIKKYSPFIYYKRYQIDEIARRLPNATIDNLEQLEEQILNELDYLDKKNLISGINIDKVDKKIIYYQNYKQEKEKDFISLNCKNCGALNDVPRTGKARCEYCQTIIEDISDN